ncbi:MAG: response regulator [Pseudomonadota bacterium]
MSDTGAVASLDAKQQPSEAVSAEAPSPEAMGQVNDAPAADSAALSKNDEAKNDVSEKDASERDAETQASAGSQPVTDASSAVDESASLSGSAASDDAPAQQSVAEPEASVKPETNQDDGHAAAQDRRDKRLLSAVLIIGSVTAAFVIASAVLIFDTSATPPVRAIAAGIAVCAALFVSFASLRFISPALLTSLALRQATSVSDAEELGQEAELLSALQLGEKVLHTDEDPRLITRRDGVVAYANKSYGRLAREAGIFGLAGLPPRIDRLFAGQGAEATKLFRLCMAAKSGIRAEETISQVMGSTVGSKRRRFDVSVRPVVDAPQYVSWRLIERPLEEEERDALAAAYADFPKPVFALEKSGQIAWENAAMRTVLGARRGVLQAIDDIVLGETGALLASLLRVDGAVVEAELRQRGGDPVDAKFSAFRRGGVGEGFVCVVVDVDNAELGDVDVVASNDLTDAPFGAAIVEGEIGRDARIIEANRAFCSVFGGVKKNAHLSRALPPETLTALSAELKKKTNTKTGPSAIEATVGEGAAATHHALFARPVRRRRGSYGAKRIYLYTVEITDQKRMEEAHAQDQKLKAIGHLAGGVAHDFNNLLQVILGNCEQLMLRHPLGDPAYQELLLIRENAQRAANMTKQLLAYSRKQTLTPKVQSITEILLDFSRFLDRAVGEKVKLEFINGRGLPPIKVDRNQLETAIMNLAVNARDAMAPSGGLVSVKTRALSEAEAREANLTEFNGKGAVEITVSDTGPGVPKDIATKIFDPFFTTKDEGKGTGLGLSTVYGVIGQMGGVIVLDPASIDRGDGAEIEGATFRIYLPAAEEEAEAASDEAADEPVAPKVVDFTGTGRILVVEDEDPVRAFVVAALERNGYDVTAVADGVDALELLEDDEEAFDIVLTDVMMPEIDGPSMIEQAREKFGLSASVIFMSGYAETAMRDQLAKVDGADYIQKPFPMASLGAKVKETLAGRLAAQ